MRKGLIISLAAAIVGLAAISCTKEDPTLRYGNATMGNIVAGKFTSDQGNIFNVTEQTCYGKLDTMQRAFVICDVLKNTGTAENEYDVRLNFVSKVLTKKALEISEIETYRNDPIILKDYWVSGGYLNIYLMVPVKENSSKKHMLNLFHEVKDGVYNFHIRHDAAGEILTENSYDGSLKFAYAYASFPVSDIIKEETANFTLGYSSYVYSGNMISAKTQPVEQSGTYNKSAFEQVPEDATVPSSTLDIE